MKEDSHGAPCIYLSIYPRGSTFTCDWEYLINSVAQHRGLWLLCILVRVRVPRGLERGPQMQRLHDMANTRDYE